MIKIFQKLDFVCLFLKTICLFVAVTPSYGIALGLINNKIHMRYGKCDGKLGKCNATLKLHLKMGAV